MNHDAADFDEARWRRLADADAVEEPLSDSDREFLERFTPRSDAARAEARLFDALARLGTNEEGDEDEAEGPDEEAANSPLVSATVAHVLAARPRATPTVAAPEPSRGRRRWAIAGLAAAAVLVASWVGLGMLAPEPAGSSAPPLADAGSTREAPAVAPPHEPVPGVPAPAPAVSPAIAAGPVVASGRFVDAGGATLATATRGTLHVASDEGCLALDGARACLRLGARVSVHPPRSEDVRAPAPEPDSSWTLAILEGEGTLEVSHPAGAPRASVMVVEIAGDRYALSSEVVMQVSVHDLKSAKVEVARGRVELVDADGRAHVLEAGAVRGKTKPHAHAHGKPQDAKTLLAKARASRSAGDRTAAISYYEKLLRHHPDLPSSHAAMVSLGDLYLDTHKPATALQWFQRYLDRGDGALAQEAAIGRIKALGALGREPQRRQAIEAFRERYPQSRYAEQLGKDAG